MNLLYDITDFWEYSYFDRLRRQHVSLGGIRVECELEMVTMARPERCQLNILSTINFFIYFNISYIINGCIIFLNFSFVERLFIFNPLVLYCFF